MDPTELKKKIHNQCITYVNERVKRAEQAMKDAQEAANNETKSTAGDKHDTARAMMQLETEQNAKQLAEVLKLRKALSQMDASKKYKKVQLGSLVKTELGWFYIAVSIGQLKLSEVNCFVISPTAPVAQAMQQKTEGDEISFNNRKNKILGVY